MQKRTLGRTNLAVSVLGFGAAPAAYVANNSGSSAELVHLMLDAGVNVIDTAASYPGSEEFVGEHLSDRRNNFVLVSKCGSKLEGLTGEAWSAGLIAESIDRSLKRTRTDAIDVMLLHSCDLKTLQQGEAIAALVKARDAGKIRHAGYSGDNEAAAYAASLPEIAVIETSINLVDQANIDRVLPVAAARNVGVIVKRPIANAAWKDIDDQPGMYRNYAKEYTNRFAQLKLSTADLGFTGDAKTAWPEIAIRFALSFPQVGAAIIGTTNPANARANLGYAERGPLPPEVVNKIRQAFRAADPKGAWTGQT